MKTIAVLLLVGFALCLLANPIGVVMNAVGPAPMLSENVLVRMNGEKARVSGSFEFDLKNAKLPANPCLRVYVPIVVREGEIDRHKTLDWRYERDTDMKIGVGRLGLAARAIHPGSPVNKEHPVVKCMRGLDLLWFIGCPDISRKTSEIEVSYTQPLIDGVFYYVPIIGSTRSAADTQKAYKIRVVAHVPLYPANGMACGYAYQSPNEMLISPTDRSLIAVTTDKSKAIQRQQERTREN